MSLMAYCVFFPSLQKATCHLAARHSLIPPSMMTEKSDKMVKSIRKGSSFDLKLFFSIIIYFFCLS